MIKAYQSLNIISDFFDDQSCIGFLQLSNNRVFRSCGLLPRQTRKLDQSPGILCPWVYRGK